MNAASYVIPLPPQASLPVVGESGRYPVRRIWCVGRNYLEHIREMGNDERAPPFFFAKHADMLVPDGATIPYPPLTKDCLLYTSPSPRDGLLSRMPSSA